MRTISDRILMICDVLEVTHYELLSGRNILVFMIPYLVQNRFSFLSGISSFHCRNFAIYDHSGVRHY